MSCCGLGARGRVLFEASRVYMYIVAWRVNSLKGGRGLVLLPRDNRPASPCLAEVASTAHSERYSLIDNVFRLLLQSERSNV